GSVNEADQFFSPVAELVETLDEPEPVVEPEPLVQRVSEVEAEESEPQPELNPESFIADSHEPEPPGPELVEFREPEPAPVVHAVCVNEPDQFFSPIGRLIET